MLDLIEQLQNTFPIDLSQHSTFRFFPICNEFAFSSIIDQLSTLETKKPGGMNVALLFGESHFLSLLPYLARCVDLVILADIEVKLHAHNLHLLSTFRKSETVSEFLHNYVHHFPELPFNIKDVPNKTTAPNHVSYLLGRQSRAFSSLKHHHFLHTTQQYRLCKDALTQVHISQIQFDLTCGRACQTLAHILGEQARIRICNVTNIHQCVDPLELSHAIRHLFRESKPECMVYSKGPASHLEPYCSSFNDYMSMLTVMPRLLQTKPSTHSYFSKHNRITHKTTSLHASLNANYA